MFHGTWQTMSPDLIDIAAIVPVYNNEPTLEELKDRLVQNLSPYGKFLIVLIDDASTDGSRRTMERLALEKDYIKVVYHEKNQGQQFAIRTGLFSTEAKFFVVMDADLQDVPEDIPKMYECLQATASDAVFARRKNFYQQRYRMVTSRIYKFAVYLLSGLPMYTGGFVLFNIAVRDKIRDMNTKGFYIAGLVAKTKLKVSTVNTFRNKRLIGSSSFNFKKRLQMAYANITCLLEK